MKVLLINGSPHENGCTYTALCEVASALHAEGIETEMLQVGMSPIRGCTGCGTCFRTRSRRCVFADDLVNVALDKMKECDGLIVGSPDVGDGFGLNPAGIFRVPFGGGLRFYF